MADYLREHGMTEEEVRRAVRPTRRIPAVSAQDAARQAARKAKPVMRVAAKASVMPVEEMVKRLADFADLKAADVVTYAKQAGRKVSLAEATQMLRGAAAIRDKYAGMLKGAGQKALPGLTQTEAEALRRDSAATRRSEAARKAAQAAKGTKGTKRIIAPAAKVAEDISKLKKLAPLFKGLGRAAGPIGWGLLALDAAVLAKDLIFDQPRDAKRQQLEEEIAAEGAATEELLMQGQEREAMELGFMANQERSRGVQQAVAETQRQADIDTLLAQDAGRLAQLSILDRPGADELYSQMAGL